MRGLSAPWLPRRKCSSRFLANADNQTGKVECWVHWLNYKGVSVRLVAAAGFKPVVGSVKQTLGGFDSHPLPLLSVLQPPCDFYVANFGLGVLGNS